MKFGRQSSLFFWVKKRDECARKNYMIFGDAVAILFAPPQIPDRQYAPHSKIGMWGAQFLHGLPAASVRKRRRYRPRLSLCHGVEGRHQAHHGDAEAGHADPRQVGEHCFVHQAQQHPHHS